MRIGEQIWPFTIGTTKILILGTYTLYAHTHSHKKHIIRCATYVDMLIGKCTRKLWFDQRYVTKNVILRLETKVYDRSTIFIDRTSNSYTTRETCWTQRDSSTPHDKCKFHHQTRVHTGELSLTAPPVYLIVSQTSKLHSFFIWGNRMVERAK